MAAYLTKADLERMGVVPIPPGTKVELLMPIPRVTTDEQAEEIAKVAAEKLLTRPVDAP